MKKLLLNLFDKKKNSPGKVRPIRTVKYFNRPLLLKHTYATNRLSSKEKRDDLRTFCKTQNIFQNLHIYIVLRFHRLISFPDHLQVARFHEILIYRATQKVQKIIITQTQQ